MSLIWKQAYADAANGFADDASVTKTACYFNGEKTETLPESDASGDAKQIFYNAQGKARVVNLADGYAVTLQTADFTPNYRFGAQRARYTSDRFVLNISREDKSPYGNTADGWKIYLTEWLNRYIADDGFLACNDISRTRAVKESTDILPGYTVLNYDMVIGHAGEIKMPYYNIAIIRKNDEYVQFYLLVMKSTDNADDIMDAMVRSFKEIETVGVARNQETALVCEIPDHWNDETKAYYQKLLDQKTVDWGVFSASMVDECDLGEYSRQAARIEGEYDRLSKAFDYPYALMPTYTHISWDSRINEFPSKMAEKYAGGNGFDGKPVLHFTYQFTTHNNTELERYTPMFDILRGRYDEQFRRLARDIKAYHKPVLFRLNNEMNTDWTSYSGIVNLLDPDIFVFTWERLYDIFESEGVDNCIWIFNPIAKSTPYSNWGEYLSFLPKHLQALGLTSYEMGNGDSLRSFKELYRELYQKNTPYFDNYPWVISEFGAGAGGAKKFDYDRRVYDDTVLGRNVDLQAEWVKEMFECLSHSQEEGYAFCRNIKGAIWFGCNDGACVDGKNYVTNYFCLDSGVAKTIDEFRKGLSKTQ